MSYVVSTLVCNSGVPRVKETEDRTEYLEKDVRILYI